MIEMLEMRQKQFPPHPRHNRLPATIWAVYALSQYKTDQKIAKALGQ